MNTEPPNQENLKEKYKMAFEGYKFFVSIRFITVAFGVSLHSALLTIYSQAVKENRFNGVAIFIVAMLFLLALFVVERRTTSLFRSLLKRGTELEFQLGFPTGSFHRITELSELKGWRSFVTHTFGIGLVYVGVFLLWVVLLIATMINKPESKTEPGKEKNNVPGISYIQTPS